MQGPHFELLKAIDVLLITNQKAIIAIDGPCCGGKSTLARWLSRNLNEENNVIHLDHFFLRPHQRSDARLATPGENVDHERFIKEVLNPLKQGIEFEYRPFDCQTGEFEDPIKIPRARINIIEGAYSCHPRFSLYYNYGVFVDIDPLTQIQRIKERNGAGAIMFFEKWIPLEEAYFRRFDPRKKADFVLYMNYSCQSQTKLFNEEASNALF